MSVDIEDVIHESQMEKDQEGFAKNWYNEATKDYSEIQKAYFDILIYPDFRKYFDIKFYKYLPQSLFADGEFLPPVNNLYTSELVHEALIEAKTLENYNSILEEEYKPYLDYEDFEYVSKLVIK